MYHCTKQKTEFAPGFVCGTGQKTEFAPGAVCGTKQKTEFDPGVVCGNKQKTEFAPGVVCGTEQETEFAPGLVGAKALNLSVLRKGLPANIGVPASVSLPFGTFERVLAAGGSQNAAVADDLKKLQVRNRARV